jgi:hypothetical protein
MLLSRTGGPPPALNPRLLGLHPGIQPLTTQICCVPDYGQLAAIRFCSRVLLGAIYLILPTPIGKFLSPLAGLLDAWLAREACGGVSKLLLG